MSEQSKWNVAVNVIIFIIIWLNSLQMLSGHSFYLSLSRVIKNLSIDRRIWTKLVLTKQFWTKLCVKMQNDKPR
jgi:hypothetical protein